jgi:hypothetical protein
MELRFNTFPLSTWCDKFSFQFLMNLDYRAPLRRDPRVLKMSVRPGTSRKEGLCISRLVDFELLFELKFEQKKRTSLVNLVLSWRKSASRVKTVERLSVPVIYLGYRAWFHSGLAMNKVPNPGINTKYVAMDIPTPTIDYYHVNNNRSFCSQFSQTVLKITNKDKDNNNNINNKNGTFNNIQLSLILYQFIPIHSFFWISSTWTWTTTIEVLFYSCFYSTKQKVVLYLS